MIGLAVAAAGVALITVGAVCLIGPVALIAVGALLVPAGLGIDFEEVTRHGQPAEPTPRKRAR